jgi:hypothetical protein
VRADVDYGLSRPRTPTAFRLNACCFWLYVSVGSVTSDAGNTDTGIGKYLIELASSTAIITYVLHEEVGDWATPATDCRTFFARYACVEPLAA